MIVILSAFVSMGPLALDTYLPALPSLSEDLSASTTATQATLTACLLGLATGQLLAGPASDARGRRAPMLIGLVAFAVLSLLCALAPSVWALIALRFLQGVAGATGQVISRAIVRDRYEGAEAASVFGLMMVVTSVAPVIAPSLGAVMLHVTSWRGTFALLGVLGALIFAATLVALPETLPAEKRHAGGLSETLAVFRRLLGDRAFVGLCASASFPIGALFAYISGSPFVLQEIYGLSPGGFALVFGINSVGITVASLSSARLVRRTGPRLLLATGLLAGCAGGGALLLVIALDGGLIALLASLFLVVAAVGLVVPNATALAMADYPDVAGSASALLGVSQFVAAAIAAPLVGLAGAANALPLAVVVIVFEIAALLSLVLSRRAGPRPVSCSAG